VQQSGEKVEEQHVLDVVLLSAVYRQQKIMARQCHNAEEKPTTKRRRYLWQDYSKYSSSQVQTQNTSHSCSYWYSPRLDI
jgi:hypothetical protein